MRHHIGKGLRRDRHQRRFYSLGPPYLSPRFARLILKPAASWTGPCRSSVYLRHFRDEHGRHRFEVRLPRLVSPCPPPRSSRFVPASDVARSSTDVEKPGHRGQLAFDDRHGVAGWMPLASIAVSLLVVSPLLTILSATAILMVAFLAAGGVLAMLMASPAYLTSASCCSRPRAERTD